MLIVTITEFREKQREILEKVDKGIQVILKRNSKAYALTPISEEDAYFSDPEVVKDIQKRYSKMVKKKPNPVSAKKAKEKYLGL